MAVTPAQLLFVLGFATLVLTFIRRSLASSSTSNLPLPPGPKGLPLVGNALQLPKTGMAQVFAKWAKVHHPFLSLVLVLTFVRSFTGIWPSHPPHHLRTEHDSSKHATDCC